MCLLFCYCVIQGVSFNYHHRNVRSRVSVSVSNSRSRSRSRLLWQSLGLVTKSEPGLDLGIGGYGLDYITAGYTVSWDRNSCTSFNAEKCFLVMPWLITSTFYYDLLINIFQKWNMNYRNDDGLRHNNTIESCSSSKNGFLTTCCLRYPQSKSWNPEQPGTLNIIEIN